MKLIELKGIISYSFDFADNEIDASFYAELNDIKDEYAKEIDVVNISRNYIICNFKDFIIKHKDDVRNYIYNNYNTPWASQRYAGIYESASEGEQADWLWSFINEDLGELLENGIGEATEC